MLRAIRLKNESDALLLTLPITDARGSSAYSIIDADGLGPVKADLKSSKFAILDGELFQSSSVGARNIVLTVQLHNTPNTKVSTIRRDLYKYFAPKRKTILEIHDTDFNPLKIEGYVESVEPVIFSQNREVQISVLCPSPYFMGLTETGIKGVMGSYLDLSRIGTAPNGFMFDYRPVAQESFVNIEIWPGDNLKYTGPIAPGERLIIDTNVGRRKARIIKPDGSFTDYLENLTLGSLTRQIDSEVTHIRVSNSTGSSDSYLFWYRESQLGY